MNKLFVLLDAGHGESTPGKRSPDGTIREYKYNRQLVDAIYDKLNTIHGIQPIKIVPELQDIPLKTRVQRINKYVRQCGEGSHCIMISVHLNAAGNGQWMSARGWSVWTTRGQNNSDKLATICYNNAVKALNGIATTRKEMSDGDPDYESNFYIIKYSNCPAILTENLFQDNKQDVAILKTKEGFDAIVDLHVNTCVDWLNRLSK
jgi:N-acetylmuramoyl-L-alanine amidase